MKRASIKKENPSETKVEGTDEKKAHPFTEFDELRKNVFTGPTRRIVEVDDHLQS